MIATDRPLDQTPGALAVTKRRELRPGVTVEFEHAPAGWIKKDGHPREDDWRAYYLSTDTSCIPCKGTGRAPSDKRPGSTIKCQACKGTGRPARRRVESVTTICDAILPKDGLAPWSERAGIRGAVEALRRRLIWPGIDPDEAVRVVRANKLGADAARDEAADRGLNVHAILEHYMLTGGDPPNPVEHPPAHRPFIQGLIRWLNQTDPEPVAVETLVADPDRNYAGRLDLLAMIGGKLTLVDLKTQERGSIYESAHVQARLYWDAEERWGEHRIEQAQVVVVDGTGTFHEMALLASSDLVRHALDYYQLVKPLCSKCDGRNRILRTVFAEAE